jgi:hypothetical protein
MEGEVAVAIAFVHPRATYAEQTLELVRRDEVLLRSPHHGAGERRVEVGGLVLAHANFLERSQHRQAVGSTALYRLEHRSTGDTGVNGAGERLDGVRTATANGSEKLLKAFRH